MYAINNMKKVEAKLITPTSAVFIVFTGASSSTTLFGTRTHFIMESTIGQGIWTIGQCGIEESCMRNLQLSLLLKTRYFIVL